MLTFFGSVHSVLQIETFYITNVLQTRKGHLPPQTPLPIFSDLLLPELFQAPKTDARAAIRMITPTVI